MLFGSDPKWLLLGIMYVTGFLSLWIQNTAAASMMLPIVIALVKQIAKYNKIYSEEHHHPRSNKVESVTTIQLKEITDINEKKLEETQISEMESEKAEIVAESESKESTPGHVEHTELPDTKAAKNLMKGFCLSIAYSASVGGAGSLVGTTPNLILKGHFDKFYPDGGLNFITYMAFAAPVAAIMIFLAWMELCLIWIPKRELLCCKKGQLKTSKKNDPLQAIIKKRYNDLGSYTWEQISVGALFLVLVLLWLTRDLVFTSGWESLFGGKKYVSDTTPAILIVILMFAWPKNNIFKGKEYEHLIGWKDFHNFPWDVILLSGGSLALAYGFEKSLLSKWLADLLSTVLPKQKEWALIIILLFNQFGTEFTSNTSMASIFIPIADRIARDSGVNPVYYLLPLTVCVSLAFMFPVATAPNAIVFGSGYIKIPDMMLSGFILKLLGVLVLFFAANTFLTPIFPINVAELYNATITTDTNITISACAC